MAEISPDDVIQRPEPETSETETSSETELPKQVLKIPAVHAILQGAPPAFYVDAKSEDPDIKTLEKHAKELNGAGIGAFPSQSIPGAVVVFNGLVLPAEEIQQADQQGQLQSVAVPWESLKADYENTGKEGEGEPAAEPAVAAAPSPSGPPAPAGAQNKLLQKRISNLALGTSSPTSGPRPGAGRILNTVVQPAI